MADAFYPFVGDGRENTEVAGTGAPVASAGGPAAPTLGDRVDNPARIAVFDDPAAAPRVVVVQPTDVRSYLEEVTATVTRLAKEQGGSISFTVIREVVENLVHAYFKEPTISILNSGNTIRFSDQGPGIREKARALEYGTTSATEEMKRYIRGVGSGLPYAQQYMEDHGGTLTIEDNISCGTIVTISMPMGDGSGQRMASAAATGQLTGPTSGTPGLTAAGQLAAMAAAQQGAPWQTPSQQAAPAQLVGVMAYPGMTAYAGGVGVVPAAQALATQQGAIPYPTASYPQDPALAAHGMAWPQATAQGTARPQGMAPRQEQPQAPAPDKPEGQDLQAETSADDGEVILDKRGYQVLEWLSSHDAVGPTDLAAQYGGSLSTWTRQLQSLEDQGILRKQGQKRRITRLGRTLL